MLSLKQLQALESNPLVVIEEIQLPVVEIKNEIEKPVIKESKTDWYIPKKPWAEIFKEWEAGIKFKGGWEARIKVLEDFFSGSILPGEIKIPIGKIIDPARFVTAHLATAKNYNGNPVFENYLIRLGELMNNCFNEGKSVTI